MRPTICTSTTTAMATTCTTADIPVVPASRSALASKLCDELRHRMNLCRGSGRASLSQLGFGGALAALIMGRLGDVDHLRMIAQELAQGAAQHAHARAVDDAYVRQSGHERAVEEARHLVVGFIGGAADDVDLHRDRVGVGGGLHGDASASACSLPIGRAAWRGRE